ncbi:hypothetical protein [Mesorhizobium onobrychidis]|uniref:hypothetical protein n=1 Tax=Mesorhizobium onobrychidis TaxID=2775404 RepID=UPI0021571463|nr:hypothetical protein [Mesorhizobium onobrychidis]
MSPQFRPPDYLILLKQSQGGARSEATRRRPWDPFREISRRMQRLRTTLCLLTASQKRGTICTSRCGVQRLVWYEEHFDIRDAIQRETSLKRWPMEDRP